MKKNSSVVACYTTAKTMANSIKEIFENPEVIEISKQELKQRTGEDFIYKPLLGDREPPLNYR